MRLKNTDNPLKYTVGKMLLFGCLILFTSCTSTQVDKSLRPESLTASESEQIELQLKNLYQSFSYSAGEEPDWDLMRSVFLEGAQFVSEVPSGESPRPQTVEEFISSWQKMIRGSNAPTRETSEQILSTNATKVGNLIRVDVLFRASKTNDSSPRKPGLDSLVFAKVGDAWKIISFVIQYESKM